MTDTSLELEPVHPRTELGVFQAATQLFRTSGSLNFAVRVILAAGILMAIIYAFAYPAYVAEIVDFSREIERNPQDPDLGSFWGFMGSALLFSIAIVVPMTLAAAAVHRKVLFDREHPGFLFRFGRDELNLFLAYAGLMLTFILVGFVTVFIIAFIFGFLSVFGSGAAAVGIIIAFLGFIGAMVAGVWLMLRFAPVGGATIAFGRPVILKARKVSKYRVGPMFGSYLLAYVFSYLVVLTLYAVAIAVLPGELGAGILVGDIDALEAFTEASRTTQTLYSAVMGVGGAIMTCWLAAVGSAVTHWYVSDRDMSPAA